MESEPAFVALGRIFDEQSTHNVGALLRLALDHPQMFSKAALARRKQGLNTTPADWLDNYMKEVYVPKPADLRRLRGYVSRHRKLYADKYRPVRHQIFAHKGLSDTAAVSALFARTNIREMQRMLTFLMSLYDALWQLFFNGHRPALRPKKYSVSRMRARAMNNAKGGRVHERLVYEAEQYLSAASASNRCHVRR